MELRGPKIRGTSLGGPKSRTLVFWGLYWAPLFRKLPFRVEEAQRDSIFSLQGVRFREL